MNNLTYIFKTLLILAIFVGFVACSVDHSKNNEDSGETQTIQPDGKKKYFPPTSETSVKGEIHISADETFQPIIRNLVDTYQSAYPQALIHVHYMSGEEAIQSMLENDSIRMVIATRELTKGESATLKAQGTSAKIQKLATDAVALVVNQTNKDSVLTFDQIKGILTGEITSWKQINKNSPLGDIQLFFDKPGSSTYQYLRDTLLDGRSPIGFFPDTTKNIPAGLAGVRAEVINRPNAIGVIGLAWISDSDSQRAVGFKQELIVCKIENPYAPNICRDYGTAYQPYQGLMKLKCYPLNRSVFSISRETRPGLLGGGFINFMIRPETGQRQILKSGLVPAFGVPRIIQFPN
jgi:phosphate transport system substrate-binding protein